MLVPMMQSFRVKFSFSVKCAAVIVCALFCYGNMLAQEIRNADGFGNNKLNPELGTSGSMLSNMSTISYSDGISQPGGLTRPNPRVISNLLFDQEGLINDAKALSDYNWVFGQFIDHDLSLVENAGSQEPGEALVIVPPSDDEFFGPGDLIFMTRSKVAVGTGSSIDNPRRHVNEITSFLDGSVIYGSDDERMAWLRSYEGGKLKVSEGNLLPWNTIDGEFESQVDPAAPHMEDGTGTNLKLYVAGDVRANENPLLIAVHTLFVREHNRICDELKAEHPNWDDEDLFQHGRRLTAGKLQSIVYNEWLPAQGIQVPEYQGYNENLDPSVSNVFSAAAFRMGHTLINSNIIRMDNDGGTTSGQISLRDAFFNPFTVELSGGIDPFLKGMGTQIQQELDCKIIDDVRNFLFGAPGEGGLDLAAININRGRERGLPDYNTLREDFGLPRANDFADINSDPLVRGTIEGLYGGIDDLDPWTGMLAEDHMKDAIFGELSMTIIERQFRLIRDGDRFYYENDPALSIGEKASISATTFHDIIMANTDISLMQDNVFMAMEHENIPDGPELEKTVISAAIYPNPVSADSKIKIYSKEATTLTISVFDISGNRISSSKVDVLFGENVVYKDFFSGLPNGAYNIKIENDLGIFTVVRAIL